MYRQIVNLLSKSRLEMTNFIPIFPLSIVVYPGESLNLHIFEPKYKQLINECFEQKKPFGMPVVINDKINELGTLVEIMEISKAYDTGEMDIKTKGQKVFRILEVINEVPDKLYSGAIVSYLSPSGFGRKILMNKVVAAIKELHKLLKVNKPFPKEEAELNSYDVAHHAGLTLDEEYEFLTLTNELHRQEYLKRHLAKVLPVVAEMELLKEKTKLNGHFKNISGFNIS
ncbi:MAG: LON peptidase substrate-binding domain-containing protein [Ginsengibacter sp.]